MERIWGAAVPALERSLRFRMARQAALAANLANIDTPGYRRVDLEFDDALARASARVGPTHPGHVRSPRENGWRIVTAPRSNRPDGNGVELEREVLAASRNAGAFTDHAAVLTRLLAITRVAIVGEAR